MVLVIALHIKKMEQWIYTDLLKITNSMELLKFIAKMEGSGLHYITITVI